MLQLNLLEILTNQSLFFGHRNLRPDDINCKTTKHSLVKTMSVGFDFIKSNVSALILKNILSK